MRNETKTKSLNIRLISYYDLCIQNCGQTAAEKKMVTIEILRTRLFKITEMGVELKLD